MCDVIVPKKTASERSIEEHYLHHHPREPWDAFIAALEARYPDHRHEIDVLRLTPLCSICNVFVPMLYRRTDRSLPVGLDESATSVEPDRGALGALVSERDQA